ncbi:hypothetical protein [Lysinibacillus sphaericus]|uniref:hypothetical protein n=1 Tax=Lysinibacillus sphaericus TaxID=1421 RepID=UPI0019D5C895|nr:hypothetical protein [Lysinibacillus sphaericus]
MSKWDELNLKINEIQLFSSLIDSGANELELLNSIINIHNRAFKKGVAEVTNEFRYPFRSFK